MNLLKALLSSTGEISTMRLMSLMSLLIGAGLACFGLYAGRDLMGLSALCAVFVTGAFGGKVAQKFAEEKSQ